MRALQLPVQLRLLSTMSFPFALSSVSAFSNGTWQPSAPAPAQRPTSGLGLFAQLEKLPPHRRVPEATRLDVKLAEGMGVLNVFTPHARWLNSLDEPKTEARARINEMNKTFHKPPLTVGNSVPKKIIYGGFEKL